MDVEHDQTNGNTPSEKSYHLSVKGDGIQVSQDIDKDTALSVISLLLGGQVATRPNTVGVAVTPSHADQTQLTLGEFVEESGARSNVDKIVAIAVYKTRYDNVSDFSRQDMNTWFQEAGEPVPGNLPRDVSVARTARYIAPRGAGSTQFYVTTTGFKALDQKFSGEAKRPTAAPKRRRRRAMGGET
jgi:hypothetical protein